MSGRVSRKRKAAWKASVARMQKAKVRKKEGHSEDPTEGSMSPVLGDSSQGTSDTRAREEEPVSTTNIATKKTMEQATDYKQWINSLERENLQMLAMMLYHNYRERFGLQKTVAAEEVGLCLGLSDKTIRIWRKTFLSNSGHFKPDSRGKYPRNKSP